MIDNAANNMKCIQKLSQLLAERDFEFDPNQHCIPCHAHLVNLCAGHACEAFTVVDASEIGYHITTSMVAQHGDTKTPVGEQVTKETYLQAVRNKPLDKAWHLICAIHASGLQWDTFHERVKQGNCQGWHKWPVDTKVPFVELLCEVVTCWDPSMLIITQPSPSHLYCQWQQWSLLIMQPLPSHLHQWQWQSPSIMQPPPSLYDNDNDNNLCQSHSHYPPMYNDDNILNHMATTSHLCWWHHHYMDDNNDNLHWSCSHHHHPPICIDVWPTTMTLMTTTNDHHLHLHGHHQPQPPPPVWWLCCYQCWQWQHHSYLLSYLVT